MDLDSKYSDSEGDRWPDETVELRWLALFDHWLRTGLPRRPGTFAGLLRALDPFNFGTVEDEVRDQPDPWRNLERIWGTELEVLHEGPPAIVPVRRTARRFEGDQEEPQFARNLFREGARHPAPAERREE